MNFNGQKQLPGWLVAFRQSLALLLSALMIMVPMGQTAMAQEAQPPAQQEAAPAPQPDNQDIAQEQPPAAPPRAAQPESEQPAAQPLTRDQLDQLVAPVALYPDSLVAQVLAAATYPTQVVEADRWLQGMTNATPDQIASGAESHNWDPSVKALTAFPTVLAQMDKNLQWTTDLGNAYYNQPQDVMDSVQAMRHQAQSAGKLQSTPQQTVTQDPNGNVAIQPANPAVVYVPVYNPWAVYGPVAPYPGYYWPAPPGVFWGGLAIGFGVGIGIGYWSHWGWGWGHWGVGWGPRWGGGGVYYNHSTYITRSTTVINRGVNRAGGPPRGAGVRGSYARTGYAPRGGTYGARPAGTYGRPGGSASRPGGAPAVNRSYQGTSQNRAYAGGRPGGVNGTRPQVSQNSGARPGGYSARPSSSSHAAAAPHSSGGHASSGHSGGGHVSGGGRVGHGR
jgi:hypothetical protein